MNQREIGQFMSVCRKEKGLTQAQLAERLGVSDKSISRWETGKTMPDLSLYEPLCEILDIKISELLYAKKMTENEKSIQGEKSALNIFKTKSHLKTFYILSEILTFVGIVVTITLTQEFAVIFEQKIITAACGSFVWGFGILLSSKIRKALTELENQ